MKRIYLDYAATTPLDPRVARSMRPFGDSCFGNPSSLHAEGVSAKRALEKARTAVARFLEGRTEEILFTSGGTEANNLALRGVLEAAGASLTFSQKKGEQKKKKLHVVTTAIEHSSVLETLRALEQKGEVEVTYVPVKENGIVDPERVARAVRPHTVLVSVMYANNEIGTIQPIRKIGTLLTSIRNSTFITHNSRNEKRYPIFHSDACQAPLYLNCLVNGLGVDLLSLDAHKIYGPKGVGALYVRRGTPLVPQLVGGGQERGFRSTTENIPGIVGFAEAIRLAGLLREKETDRVASLRDYFHSRILKNVRMEGVLVNGSMKRGERLPNNLNISLPGVDTEFLTLELDARGIAVSTKSSCLRDEKYSSVVEALGGGRARATSTLRCSLGRGTTKTELDTVLKELLDLIRTRKRGR